MALDYLPSPGWAVIYGETPSATRWSELGDNDDALALGTGIDDLAILNRHLALGSVKIANLSTAASELGAAWTTWTPTFSNSAGSCTVNVTYAKYIKVGKTVIWRMQCNVTAASANGSLAFTPPANAANANEWAGAGREDSGTGNMTEVLFKGSTSSVNILFYNNSGQSCTTGYSHIIGGSYECA